MNAKYDFSGQTVLITGASSGIGKATAEAFGKAGANVAIADLNEKGAAATAAIIRDQGGVADHIKTDVSDEDQVKAMVKWVVERFGGLHIVHNNAGIEGENVPLADWSSDNWRHVINVNLNSVFYCLKAEIAHMVKHGGGAIINTASISGLSGGYNLSAYTAAKHGVVGLTKAAAMDYATQNIRVNTLCPGLVDTPFIAELPKPFRDRLDFGTPMSRPADATEVANAVLWLASDAASYVTGHALAVDGGTVLGGVGTRFDDLM